MGLQGMRMIVVNCGAAAAYLLSPLSIRALSCARVSPPHTSPFLSCASCCPKTKGSPHLWIAEMGS